MPGARDRDRLVDELAASFRNGLERHVSPGDSVALVGFPNHSNVGDSAIWL